MGELDRLLRLAAAAAASRASPLPAASGKQQQAPPSHLCLGSNTGSSCIMSQHHFSGCRGDVRSLTQCPIFNDSLTSVCAISPEASYQQIPQRCQGQPAGQPAGQPGLDAVLKRSARHSALDQSWTKGAIGRSSLGLAASQQQVTSPPYLSRLSEDYTCTQHSVSTTGEDWGAGLLEGVSLLPPSGPEGHTSFSLFPTRQQPALTLASESAAVLLGIQCPTAVAEATTGAFSLPSPNTCMYLQCQQQQQHQHQQHWVPSHYPVYIPASLDSNHCSPAALEHTNMLLAGAFLPGGCACGNE